MLEQVEEADKVLDLDQNDAYVMAFTALHWDSRKQLQLDDEDVELAF